jgi:hypothetical protein
MAAVNDLFSRRVVGWSMSAAMTAQLVTDPGDGPFGAAASPTRHCITRIAAASRGKRSAIPITADSWNRPTAPNSLSWLS